MPSSLNQSSRISRISLADIQRQEEEERRKKQRQQNSIGFEQDIVRPIGGAYEEQYAPNEVFTPPEFYTEDDIERQQNKLYAANKEIELADAAARTRSMLNSVNVPQSSNVSFSLFGLPDDFYNPAPPPPEAGTSPSNQQLANVVDVPNMSSESYARHNNPLVTPVNDYPAQQGSIYYDLEDQEYRPDIPAGYADIMHMQMQGDNPGEGDGGEFIGIAPELNDTDRAILDDDFDRSRIIDRAQMRRDHADSVLSRLVRDIRSEEDPGKRQGIAAGLGAYSSQSQNAGREYADLVTGYEASDVAQSKLQNSGYTVRDMSSTIAALAKKHNVSSDVVAGLVRENQDKNGGVDLAEVESALSPAKPLPAPADMRNAMSRDYMDLVRSDDSLTPEKFLSLRGIRADDPLYASILEELNQALKYIPSYSNVQFEMEDTSNADDDYATVSGVR